MKPILLIGAGGIGRRHLQACTRLDAARYRLFVVEPSDASWAQTEAMLDETPVVIDGVGPSVERYLGLDALPDIDFALAIVATSADVRAEITRRLLATHRVAALVLEKVLFQRVDDYSRIGGLLTASGIPTWVNCPRRMWPGYATLAERVGDAICRVEVHGQDWDLGCNAIHFIDLVDFLCGPGSAEITSIEIDPAPRAAKRHGMLHLSGVIEGVLQREARSVGFRLCSSAVGPGGFAIELTLTDGGIVRVDEIGGNMRVSLGRNGEGDDTHTPFQSELTDRVVEDVVVAGSASLTGFEQSSRLHLALLQPLAGALCTGGWIDTEDACPIT